jgi:hypothetical protein
MNCTLTKGIIVMLLTHLILWIPWFDMLESREKLTHVFLGASKSLGGVTAAK